MNAFIQHLDSKTNKAVLQALIPFVDLVDSVIFTNRANPNDVDKAKNDISRSSYQYYQRRIDMSRISKIEDFIIDSILDEKDGVILATLFPSSMILAINDDENSKGKNEVRMPEVVNGVCEVILNDNVFIVDGQHRMMAMSRVYNKLKTSDLGLSFEEKKYVLEYIKQFKFNCTILVNYDLWEQGQVFINVNFKQKPVNKSLYYEIFGSRYCEGKTDWKRNTIYLAHCMARSLNEHSESPYKGRVKMLGTGKGFVSQAFIVESLLRHFRKDGLWYYDVDSSNLQSSDYNYFSTELLSYFCAVKQLFDDYWPKDDKPTIVCKSTAFGAFVRLMDYVRMPMDQELKKQLQNSALFGETSQDYINHAIAVLTPLVRQGERLFGDKSDFKDVSGKGSESKLYRRMKQILDNSNLHDATLPEIVEPGDISMQLLEYLWIKPVPDLDPLAHSSEVDEVNDLKVINCHKDGDSYNIKCEFTMSATLYIDNDDSKGFNMNFPTTCSATFKIINGALLLDKDTVVIKVDTSDFYA